ncbi:MAG: GTPase HflX [Bacteroidia bacterium]|nr:GTPase HflX [Bacteroidia bacterium]MDW8158300.1 GTPase HflX [Bacteroidia bacterium]
MQQKAILVGIWNKANISYEQAVEYLNELSFLAETAGILSVYKIIHSLHTINPATFVGSGKLQEIKAKIEELNANLVIFDDDLSPTQFRNIEKILGVKILDRSGIILHIFAEHAQTAQAKLQVELASLQYTLPRLTRLWTHHSRERGGIGLKGAGEQEIETDRRLIRNRIAKLKEELCKIQQQAQTRRKNREMFVKVALVGYTNVGKSSIMNLIAKANVLAENKLFATLDTTTRKVVLEYTPFLLSDTVGFIRKLPHNLIESFKSTLAEVNEADILVHIVDISNAHYMEHIKVVKNTLLEIDALDKPTLLVFNKIDLLEPSDLEDLKKSWMCSQLGPSVFISVYQKINIDEFKNKLIELVREQYRYKYPELNDLYLPVANSDGL